jgi:hypothetical protein
VSAWKNLSSSMGTKTLPCGSISPIEVGNPQTASVCFTASEALY